MSEESKVAPETQSTADSLYNEKPVTAPVDEVAPPKTEEAPAPAAKEEPAPKADDKVKTPEEQKESSEEKPDENKEEKEKGKEESGDKKVPEKYELKLPENSLISTERLGKIEAEAKQRGLSQEEAQALVDRDHGFMSELVTTHNEKVEGWKNQAAEDKEIGGPDFKKNVQLAHGLVEKFGTKELKEGLDSSGFGNHPELLRLLVRLGKAAASDEFVPPNSTEVTAPKSAADILYST